METQDEVDTIDEIEALAEEAEEPPEPPAPPEPPEPPELEEAEVAEVAEVAEEELAADEAVEKDGKPYWQRVYDGDIESPAFKHVDSEGVFTDYTLDEVLASDKGNAQKAAYLAGCIAEYKEALAATDYIALKLAEGAATADEYAQQISERQTLRDTINTYQDAINTLNTQE